MNTTEGSDYNRYFNFDPYPSRTNTGSCVTVVTE